MDEHLLKEGRPSQPSRITNKAFVCHHVHVDGLLWLRKLLCLAWRAAHRFRVSAKTESRPTLGASRTTNIMVPHSLKCKYSTYEISKKHLKRMLVIVSHPRGLVPGNWAFNDFGRNVGALKKRGRRGISRTSGQHRRLGFSHAFACAKSEKTHGSCRPLDGLSLFAHDGRAVSS